MNAYAQGDLSSPRVTIDDADPVFGKDENNDRIRSFLSVVAEGRHSGPQRPGQSRRRSSHHLAERERSEAAEGTG